MSFSQFPKLTPASTNNVFEETTEQRKSELVNSQLSSTVSRTSEKPTSFQMQLFVEQPTACELKKTIPSKNWNYVSWVLFVFLFTGSVMLNGCCTPSVFERNNTVNDYGLNDLTELSDGSTVQTYKPALVLAQHDEDESMKPPVPASRKMRNPLTPIITFFKKETDDDILGPEKSEHSQSLERNSAVRQPSVSAHKNTPSNSISQTNGLSRSKMPEVSGELKKDETKPRYTIPSRPTDSPEIANLIADLNAAENVNFQQAELLLQELRQYDPAKIQPDIYQFNIAVVRSKLIPVLEKYQSDEEIDENALLPESLKRSTAPVALKRVPQRPNATPSNRTASEETFPIQQTSGNLQPRPQSKRVAKKLQPQSRNDISTQISSQRTFANRENVEDINPAPMPGSNVTDFRQNNSRFFETLNQKASDSDPSQEIPQGQFAALPDESGNGMEHSVSYNDSTARFSRPQSAYGNAQNTRRTGSSGIQQAHYQQTPQGQPVPKISQAGYSSQETFKKYNQQAVWNQDTVKQQSDTARSDAAETTFRGRSRFPTESEHPVQEWEYSTFSAIQALKQQIAQSDDKEAILADTVRLRLLEATLGIESESRNFSVPGASESVSSFFSEEIQGISTLLNEQNAQNMQERLHKAQPHLHEAKEHLVKLCPLKIRNMQFIRHSGQNPPQRDDFLGFGLYTPVKAEFKVDDFAPIYMELENLTVHGNESVGYNVKANFDYEILDATGNSLVKRSVTQMDDTRRSKTWNVAYMIPVDLISLPPGHYYVIIRVIDQNHLRLQMDSQRLDFIIRAPAPQVPKA